MKLNRNYGIEIEFYGFNGNRLGIAEVLAEEKINCLYWDGYYAKWRFPNSSDAATEKEFTDSWKVKGDGSLGPGGNELVSPILSGESGLEQLYKICEVFKKNNFSVKNDCGLHIHVNAKDLTALQIINVAKRYQQNEEVIDGWMKNNRRENENEFCYSLKNHNFFFEKFLNSEQDKKPEILCSFINNRYYKVNIRSFVRHGTIEFRQHHGTIDFEEISNWAKFCVEFTEASKEVDSVIPLFHGIDPGVQNFYKKQYLKLSEKELPLNCFSEPLDSAIFQDGSG